MSLTRRATITARVSSLSILEGEARRRGVTLAIVIAEAIDEKAARLRRRAPALERPDDGPRLDD